MRTNNNIYISDLLSVPMPKHATSHEDYLRRICLRRIFWGLLPYLGQIFLAILALGVTTFGLMALTLGLGG